MSPMPEYQACTRCGVDNPVGMRFCKDCGGVLPAAVGGMAGGLAGAGGQGVVGAPLAVGGPTPASGAKAPACARCQSVGDPGAEFCKFCGARYGAIVQEGMRDAMGTAPEASPRSVGAPEGELVAGMGEAPASLVAILKDGSDGRVFPVFGAQVDLGRVEGQIVFADDPYLSPRHARILRRGDGFILRDLDSVNGTYVRLREPVVLTDGDMILIGQQVLRFEVLSEGELPLGPATQHGVLLFGTPEVSRIARLVQYTTEGVGRDVHYLYREETVLGRENGDIVFTDDPFLSRRHAAITADRVNRRFILRDLSSSNGTAIRFRGERALAHNDYFRVGRHLFRFDRHGLERQSLERLSGVDGGRGGR